nr:hypothetical protein [Tanacetum cinerariifolium]
DIFNIVSIAIHSGTARVSSVASTVVIMTVEEADSDRGVIGLAISLPLYLVEALDLVEDDCFDGGVYDL